MVSFCHDKVCRLGAEWYRSGFENRGPDGRTGSSPVDGVLNHDGIIIPFCGYLQNRVF